jgi:hypothetical protein
MIRKILGRCIVDSNNEILDTLTEEEEFVRTRHSYDCHRR